MNIPSFSGQVGRNTTGYRDPFAAAVNSGLPKPAPLIAPGANAAQVAKNTTAYPTLAPGGGPTSTPFAPIPSPGAASATSNANGPKTDTAAPAGSAGPASSAYDLSTDPIVQKIRALNTANYGTAVAGAQASAKQDLIDSGFSFGDAINSNPDLASTIGQSPIGSVLTDDATNLAAKNNPFSTAAGLANTHTGNNNTINENENAANLFYSSDRANQLGQESQNYLGSVAGAQGSLAQQLSALLTGLTTEKGTEQQKEADAIETARQNAITNAIAGGQVMLGYDANGNPIFGSAPGAKTPTAAGAASTGPGFPAVSPTPSLSPSSPLARAPIAGPPGSQLLYYGGVTPPAPTVKKAGPAPNAAQVKKNSY